MLCIESSVARVLFFNSPRTGSFNFNIKICGYFIDLVDSIHCLKLTFDRKLNFGSYIANVFAKVCLTKIGNRSTAL